MVCWWVLVRCGQYDIQTYMYNWYQFLNYIPVQHMYRPNVVEVIYKEPFDPGYFKNLKRTNGFHEITDKELAVLWLVIGFFQSN